MKAASRRAAGRERAGDEMATDEVTRGNKLSIGTQVVSLLVLLGTIITAWNKVDGRVTMAEHRIIQLEAMAAAAASKREGDTAALLQLAGEVKAQNVAIQNVSAGIGRVEGQIKDLRPRQP